MIEKIALEVLEEELAVFTERPKPLAKRLYSLLLTQQENKPLHSKYITPLKNFFNQVNKEDYIEPVSNSYVVSIQSIKYTQGPELKRLKQQIVAEILISKLELTEEENSNCIRIHKDNLKHIKDFWVIGKVQSEYKNFYNIPLEAKQEILYLTEIGREYNNFNRMSQVDRALTNTPHEIDLSSAVQNIFINQYALINDISYQEALNKFPAHKKYITNKKTIRTQFAKEQNKSEEQIKKDITKISFRGGSKKDYKGLLLDLFNETIELTKPILELIHRMDERLPIKKHIITRATNKKMEKKLKSVSFRSKLFFYYEYQENKIREAMMEYVNNPSTKQVHDAIYTEEEQDKKKIQEFVKEKMGFSILL